MAKNNNAKRIKKEKYHTEEEMEMTQFIKILVVLVILVLGVYFFTRIFVTKDLFGKDDSSSVTTKGEYNYNATLIGNMFNRPEKDYYVMIYDTENINAVYYSGLISNYSNGTNKDKALPIYFADLNNGLNKKYVTEDKNLVNVNTTDFDKFKVGELALIKVSNGKIAKSLTNEDEIAKELDNKQESNK